MASDLCIYKTETAESVPEFKGLLMCCANEGYTALAVNKVYVDVILTAK
jgi:hypothetical protein